MYWRPARTRMGASHFCANRPSASAHPERTWISCARSYAVGIGGAAESARNIACAARYDEAVRAEVEIAEAVAARRIVLRALGQLVAGEARVGRRLRTVDAEAEVQ